MMNEFDGCLLCSDIDGTLLTDGYLPNRNIEAINTFAKKKGKFCLSTGRCVCAIESIKEQLPGTSLAIVYNGGMIYDYSTETILYQKILNDSDKYFFKLLYDKINDICIEVYCGKQVFWLRKNEASKIHFLYEGIKASERTFEEIFDLPWNKAMCLYTRDGHKETVEKIIEEFNSKSCYFVGTTFEAFGNRYYGCEMLPQGADKGTALNELSKILSIKKGNAFAIGDYYNDLTMLQQADISSAPNSAPDDIKRIVNFVGCDCREGAVADFIEYLYSISSCAKE